MNAVVTPRLEAAFGALPLAENPTWTDISKRVRSCSTNTQLGEEGTFDAVLDNRDRALEPEYTGSPYYPNVVPNLRLRLRYKEPSTNLLDYDASTAEGGFGGISATFATLTRTTAQAAEGSYSFQATATNPSSTTLLVGLVGTFEATTAVRVTPSAIYTVLASCRPASTVRDMTLTVVWHNAAGTAVGSHVGSTVTQVAGTWTAWSMSSTAPSTAAYLRFYVTVLSPAANEVHYVDRLGVFAGSAATWAAGTAPAETEFDGYVDKVIPGYRWGVNGGDAVVTVRCTDLTKILARHRIRPPYDTEVLADKPRHWWPFGDTDGGATAQDAGSDPRTFTFTRHATLGGEPVVKASNRTSLKMTESTAGTAQYAPSGLHTVEIVWDGTTGDGPHSLAQVHVGPIRFTQWNASNGSVPQCEVVVEYGGPGSTGQVSTDLLSNNAADGQFVVAVTQTATRTFEVRLNGSLVSTLTVPAGQAIGGYSARPGVFHIFNPSFPAYRTNIAVRIGHVSIYEPALTAARILAHAQAARTPWGGDNTGQRVGRILDAAGVPTSMRDVESGTTTGLGHQVEPVEGVSALSLARTAEETEFGRMFAHAGKWVFRDRRSLDGTTPVAVFGDANDGVEIPYSDLVEDFSEDHIVRTATVTRQGGNPQTYTDPAATTADATFGENKDGLLYATDGEAYDAAAYLVTQGKTPALRFEAVTLKGERSQAVMRQVAARRIGDKVTVRRRPPGGGPPQEKTVVIEGVAHDIDLSRRTWHATYRLAPVDTATYWTLEDDVLGLLDSTTVLAF